MSPPGGTRWKRGWRGWRRRQKPAPWACRWIPWNHQCLIYPKRRNNSLHKSPDCLRIRANPGGVMLKGRERHGVGEVIAVDRNYVPMQEVSRRRALCAVVAGRAHVLNPATFERHRPLDGRLELIIFPHAQACSDSKLLIGRLERRVLRRDHYLCQYEGCQRKATTV